MLGESELVLGPVSGAHLDPLLLAESQTGEAGGIVLIAFGRGEPLFDILFLNGPRIRHAARMGPNYRYAIDPAAVKEKFSALCSEPSTTITFFRAPEADITTFIATLYFEPFLRCDLAPLSPRQRVSLLEKNVRPGTLLELDRFRVLPPIVVLRKLDPTEGLETVRPLPNDAILSLYDTGVNSELLEEKKRLGILPAPSEGKFAQKRFAKLAEVDPGQQELFPTEEAVDEIRPASARQGKSSATVYAHPSELTPEQAQFVAAMRDLISRFRHRLHDKLGKKAVPILERGEAKVKGLVHGFDRTNLDMDTAHFALEYVRFVTTSASFFLRRHVRKIATDALSELYENHYDILDQYELLDDIEKMYYRFRDRGDYTHSS